jgi:hypothetical protein
MEIPRERIHQEEWFLNKQEIFEKFLEYAVYRLGANTRDRAVIEGVFVVLGTKQIKGSRNRS